MLIGVLGTLLGTVVGLAGSYFSQRAAYRREAAERLAAVRREIYVDFLASVHQMYIVVRRLHREHGAGTLSAQESAERLRSLSPESAQVALESLRLVASDSVAAAAGELWARMRVDAEPLGADLTTRRKVRWRRRYWNDRRALIDAARVDSGFGSLEWPAAGVGLGRVPPSPAGVTEEFRSLEDL